MDQSHLVKQAYQDILKHFITYGRAPHYIEIAQHLDIGVEEARILVRETAAASPIASCWLSHDTDYIESWAPFSNIPNHIQVTIDGQKKWFGQ